MCASLTKNVRPDPKNRRDPPTRSRNRNKIKKQIAHLEGELWRVDKVSEKRCMNDETGRKRSLPFNLCNNGEWRAGRRVARWGVLSACADAAARG